MIPEFPRFKTLELSDKEEVEKITAKYPPYSDFNFVSMWCWDIKGNMGLSMLNGNLVVRFTDYLTGEPFYSFLGDQKVNETAETLLDLCKKEGLKPRLKLVPEVVAREISSEKFRTEEDPDQFDYVYKNESLANFSGEKLKNKKYLFNKFLTRYPSAKISISISVDDKTKEDIIKLDKQWANHKLESCVDFDVKNETQAVEKFFAAIDKFNHTKFVFFCLYIEGKLVGFSISSILNEDYVLCHFTKGDIEYIGVYEYILKNYAEYISKIAHFMNYEQDLGLPGLRFSKNSFKPSSFLKKYVILK